MKQRQLFDKNPNLFTFGKTAIVETTGQLMPLSSQYLGQQQHRFNQTLINSSNDLYKDMKPLVLLGRIILIIPCSKSNFSTYKQMKLSLSLLPLSASVLFAIWTFIQVILNFKFVVQDGGKGHLGAMGYVAKSHFFMNSLMQFIMYVYFIIRSDKFYRIFDKWSEITARINLEEDKFLKHLAYILVASLAAPLAVYLTFMADLFNRGSLSSGSNGNSTPTSTLELFFHTVLRKWADFIPYNPCFVIFHVVFDIWTAFSRFFIPPLIMFFSRATSFQFKKLIETATEQEDVSEAHNVDMRNKGKALWQEVVKKHRELVHLVRTMNNFLSPIVFSWVVLNIYNVSMLLYRTLGGHNSFNIPTYLFTFGFTVDVTTFVITIISAALVNKNAVKILVVLRNCPKEDFYDTEVCRLEHQIATGPEIGFGGLGCFCITKPFLLKVFNAVFTMEIIMLQAMPHNNMMVDQNNKNG